ncbi:uncharacterized protein LOC131041706 [Cryptomeria japonica]|uniref:uncharacterized protein LOC131041706 n=1 Tax=Cryptomeria japonica TaxID=3369 RepID=UPI0025AD29EF|nr:uncharacterized protein LOC131041706 [Cryptomeria japonica]XP_057830873.1 uncharacterized protein LOC131041706 [Cryptomeria japonica]
MASHGLKDERSGAEVYYGAEMCYKKSLELLEAMDLPKGLLPLKDLEETGYVKETGFVWLKQKKPFEHYNKKTGKTVFYGTELTSYVGKRSMKKMTGVKSKELLFWIHITEMAINDPSSKKIYFKSNLGIGKSFPIDAFQLEDEE